MISQILQGDDENKVTILMSSQFSEGIVRKTVCTGSEPREDRGPLWGAACHFLCLWGQRKILMAVVSSESDTYAGT